MPGGGLSRETLTRWRNYDPIFQAALNERRVALWSGAADGIRAAVQLALDTVREELNIGARRDPLDLLTRTGLLGTRSGSARAAGSAGAQRFLAHHYKLERLRHPSP